MTGLFRGFRGSHYGTQPSENRTRSDPLQPDPGPLISMDSAGGSCPNRPGFPPRLGSLCRANGLKRVCGVGFPLVIKACPFLSASDHWRVRGLGSSTWWECRALPRSEVCLVVCRGCHPCCPRGPRPPRAVTLRTGPYWLERAAGRSWLRIRSGCVGWAPSGAVMTGVVGTGARKAQPTAGIIACQRRRQVETTESKVSEA